MGPEEQEFPEDADGHRDCREEIARLRLEIAEAKAQAFEEAAKILADGLSDQCGCSDELKSRCRQKAAALRSSTDAGEKNTPLSKEGFEAWRNEDSCLSGQDCDHGGSHMKPSTSANEGDAMFTVKLFDASKLLYLQSGVLLGPTNGVKMIVEVPRCLVIQISPEPAAVEKPAHDTAKDSEGEK